MAWLKFMWEQVAGRNINDLCNWDPDTQYILFMGTCGKRELIELSEYLKTVNWYADWAPQTLWHDWTGELVRA